ncbi:type II toxin-antitoxin system VapC family toxin [Mesorhizobium sp. VNQ89]|uniref:PIN domain-containing protein n=1 Tax=Mesorhizobium quangtriensis TaxID=3157709 RepID=UPI0032B7ECC8
MAQGARTAASRMITRVIDTSVIMAVVLVEPGYEVAARLANGAAISSVNLAEVVAKCIDRQVPPEVALSFMKDTNVEVVGFDDDLAIVAGELQRKARKGVLSLGDRACIATAMRLNATVVTADRIWASLDIDCAVELIR